MDFANLPEQLLQLPNNIGQVSFDDSGDIDGSESKPIFVCLPGIGDTRSSYRFLAPLLHGAGYRTLRSDIRGMGASSAKFDDFSAESVGKDIVALISHVRSLTGQRKRRFILVSNSMTAAAAVYASAELGKKVVTHIVMLGPFVRDAEMGSLLKGFLRVLMGMNFNEPEYTFLIHAILTPNSFHLMTAGGFWGVSSWGMYYKSLFKTNTPSDQAQHVQEIQNNLREPGRHSAMIKTLFASKATCTARISEVKSKVLVLMGSKDPDFTKPADEVAWIKANFREGLVQSEMVEGAGHYPHQEFPQTVAQSILDFVN
jgi:pimeloyl-ACP methyl ester carboxylesterase